MLTPRALHALVALTTGAARDLLRCGTPHLLDTASGGPGQPAPLARPTATGGADETSGYAILAGRPQTVTFGLDGQTYEIDLDDEHADELRSTLQRYIDAGRRIGQPPSEPAAARSRPTTTVPMTGRRQDSAAIRAWARAHGHQVSDRGRIPAAVLTSYEAAQQRARPTGPISSQRRHARDAAAFAR
jgi:hypothetical protein